MRIMVHTVHDAGPRGRIEDKNHPLSPTVHDRIKKIIPRGPDIICLYCWLYSQIISTGTGTSIRFVGPIRSRDRTGTIVDCITRTSRPTGSKKIL